MIGSCLSKRERVAAWCRGKTRLIAFTLCTAIILVFVSVYLANQTSPTNTLETFSCRFSGNTFSIDVEVELSDGMDQEEAINVATCALNSIPVVNSEEQIGTIDTSASADPNGIWSVKVKCTHTVTSWMPGHWGSIPIAPTLRSFEIIIDPINRTVEGSMQVIEHH